jgi:hypothetical protein
VAQLYPRTLGSLFVGIATGYGLDDEGSWSRYIYSVRIEEETLPTAVLFLRVYLLANNGSLVYRAVT